MITRADIELLANGLITIDQMAREKLHQLLEQLFISESSLDQIRDALSQEMAILAEFYAQISGAHAAQWYELLREKEAVSLAYIAQVPELVDVKELSKDIRREMRFAYEGNIEETKRALKDVFSRRVRNASRKTVVHNVVQDPAKPGWARVPKGSETCAFCDIMASKGFIYRSPESAGKGEANRFHLNCDCSIVPIWDKNKVKIEGYDPEVFMARYKTALKSLKEKFPPELGVVFDERWVVREMNILFPDVYGFKGSRAGDIPFTERKALPFTKELAKHIWDGDEDGGGHSYGLGKPGKTEFPESWNSLTVEVVTRELLFYGKAAYPKGNFTNLKLEGLHQDVIIRAWINDAGTAAERLGTVHPIRGAGIFKNLKDGTKESKPLQSSDKKRYNELYGSHH